MFADGARPRPPASCAPRSLMMSPKRLQVTMTSNWLGSRTISIASVSMYKWCESTSVYSRRTCLKTRSEEHTSELQSPCNLVCRLLLEKKKKQQKQYKSML